MGDKEKKSRLAVRFLGGSKGIREETKPKFDLWGKIYDHPWNSSSGNNFSLPKKEESFHLWHISIINFQYNATVNLQFHSVAIYTINSLPSISTSI